MHAIAGPLEHLAYHGERPGRRCHAAYIQNPSVPPGLWGVKLCMSWHLVHLLRADVLAEGQLLALGVYPGAGPSA